MLSCFWEIRIHEWKGKEVVDDTRGTTDLGFELVKYTIELS